MAEPGRKARVTDDDILAVFADSDDPVLSTREVTDEVSIKRRTTLRHLDDLEADGMLESKTVGGRATVWWTTEDSE